MNFLSHLKKQAAVCAFVCVGVLPSLAGIPKYDFSNIIQTNFYGGIHSMAKDAEGWMWCCGHEAVFRYDGYSFRNLTPDITVLSANDNWNFDNVVVASSNRVYVGSNHGLLLYDAVEDSFSLVHSGNVGSLCYDGGCLWMALDGKPVCMDVESSELKMPQVVSSTGVDKAHFVLFCTDGEVFAAWNNNLMLLDVQTFQFCHFATVPARSPVKSVLRRGSELYVLTQMDGLFRADDAQSELRLITNPQLTIGAKKLHCDKNGIIWASSQSGILFYDTSTGEVKSQSHEMGRPESLPVSSVWDIYGDPKQGVWISTYGGRLVYTDLSDVDIKYFSDNLPYPIVGCFCQADDGRIWLGTEGGGLAAINSATGEMSYLSSSNGLLSNYVKNLYNDGKGHIIVSTYNGGVQQVNARTLKVGKSIAGGTDNVVSAYCVLPSRDGGYWLTSPDERLKHVSADGSLQNVELYNDTGISFRSAEDVFRNGSTLYFVTGKGLFLVDEASRTVKSVKLISDGEYDSDNLICYAALESGDIWAGTNGRGINVLSTSGEYARLHVEGENPIASKTVFSIVEDPLSSTVWICCEDGFYSYDEHSRIICRESEILLKGAAMRRSCFRSEDGKLYFGSSNGYVSFTPSLVRHNSYKPNVFFTEIKVNDVMYHTHDLGKIKYNDVNISIGLACDSYMYPQNNRFAYSISGLSNEWTILPQGQHIIQVVNLRPGRYTIRVKASNNTGLWGDEEEKITFVVTPLPMLSWWAIVIYSLVILSFLVMVWYFFVNRKLYEQRLKMEQMRAEDSRKQAIARTKFLTNISHDLKTPLTLLADPLRRMKENMPQDSPMEQYVMTIDRNVHRISHMISQMLHFRELESQKLVLNNQEDDFVRFAEDIFGLFEPLASQKGIEMIFKSQSDKLVMSFDHDVIEKILSNLVSNAIKYTVTDGMVGLNISNDDSKVYLSVVNTGTGIPEDKKDLIFGEFAKLPGQHPNFQSSTGLGLAIVKELMTVLGGSIELHSSDSRVEFAVSFPYEKAPSKGYDMPYEYDYASSEVDNLMNEYVYKSGSVHTARKAHSVLVVDDDPQMRAYLESNLSDKFNVYTAADGADALAKADKINPQVIVSDFMMPEMDGFELCRMIRADIRISHIAVIILSGLDNREARLKAMESGANVFMGKPVDVEVLAGQIDTLIRSQAELREKYSKRFIAEPSKLTISSMDEKLLEKAMKCIEKNMENFDYDVDAFVSDMAIGRTVMYRKIKDITGMSVKEFIMDMRLKRAVQLIKESDYNISEISMMTGFINPKYFSVCFKRHYDMTPSEYKKKFL